MPAQHHFFVSRLTQILHLQIHSYMFMWSYIYTQIHTCTKHYHSMICTCCVFWYRRMDGWTDGWMDDTCTHVRTQVRMYVRMHACIHVYMHTHTYIYICICIYIYIHIYDIHMSIYIYVKSLCINNISIYTHTYIHVYMCVFIFMYVCMYVCTYTPGLPMQVHGPKSLRMLYQPSHHGPLLQRLVVGPKLCSSVSVTRSRLEGSWNLRHLVLIRYIRVV